MADTGKQFDVEVWLAEHGDYLYRYALVRANSEETARDLVQDTLIAAWQSRERFRGDSSIRTWLVGILKHKIIDHIRRIIRERRLNEQVGNDPISEFFDEHGKWRQPVKAWNQDPEHLCQDRDFLATLRQCLAGIPERHADVFRLREFEGESTDAVCKALDITSTNMHVIMHRARLALRSCLERRWFDREE